MRLFFLFLICLLLLPTPGRTAPVNDSIACNNYESGPQGTLSLYQKYISPAKGGNTCPMAPSCSQYARVAFQNYSPLKAYLLTCDRLIRCGQDRAFTPGTDSAGRIPDSPLGNGVSVPLLAARKILISPDNAMWPYRDSAASTFARRLLLRGEYRQAGDEYRRMIDSEKDTAKRDSLFIELCYCLLMGRDYGGFLDYYSTLLRDPGLGAQTRLELDLLLAKTRYLLGDYEGSTALLELHRNDSASALHGEIEFMATLDFAQLSEWESARAHAARVPASSGRYSAAARCAFLDSSNSGRLKSPGIAGALSLVPGAGYLYLGRPGTALAALVINGLFIWTAAESLQKKNYAVGTTAVFLGTGWYFGNMWGAFRAAHQQNRQLTRESIDRCLTNN